MKRLLHSDAGVRALAVVLGALLCALFSAAPARANLIRHSIGMSCLTGLDVCQDNLFGEDLSRVPPPAVPAWLARYLFGSMEGHLTEMLAEESWGVWSQFETVPWRMVPVAEAGRIIQYARDGYLPKRPVPYYRGWATKKPKVGHTSGGNIKPTPGEALLTLFRQPPNYYRGGLFKPAKDRLQRGPFNPFRWISNIRDQWSTAEWDTMDFLGRLIRVGLIVLGVLALIEGLHVLINLGRRRQQPPETPE